VRNPTRRGLLAAATAALPALASCKGIALLGKPPSPRPDVAVVRAAIHGETLLIARYGAVLAAVPALAATLNPVLSQHREHLAGLRAVLIDPRAAARPSPSAPSPGPVPATPAAALGYLRDAEHAASAALLQHLAGVSPSCAQLLASIAASEATHVTVLHQGRPR
jgi:hypothetical protein